MESDLREETIVLDEKENETYSRFYKGNCLVKEKWFKNNELHRDSNSEVGDLPAEIRYYENGIICIKLYSKNGFSYREHNLPCFLRYHINGNIKTEFCLCNDKIHREGDLPALVEYYENGNKQYEKYYKNDQLHRDHSLPAYISYYQNGNVEREEYWVNNNFIRSINGSQN